MASELPLDHRASYSVIIDDILATADLETISAKAIRKALQEQVSEDLTEKKDPIKHLIMERFDKVQRERSTEDAAEPAPTTNGAPHADQELDGVAESVEKDGASSPPSNKRKASSPPEDDDEELSDVKDTPPPKKAKKASKPKPKAELEETDEQMARRLAAEYAAPGRATRGGGAKPRKPAPKKEKGKTKKKSAAKINSDDDSEVEGGSTSPKPEKEKKGGFHKPMNLSEPLQQLLGETQLSRPQTVKRIWEYVRAHELQDPKDKRNIRCDDQMRAVFKSDKIHMFTMNKVLAGQLYPVEE
ncbi:hypothetical protein KC332_g17832 [Hortaea werneckii]|uniref:Uncharacterized protein n=1 Tax=Hortaea werneckii TaxID=91943 RepID=A0A3M7IZ48_HORWE|nr:hypothetical protein KC350_g17760 [Hortaea werneckii]KAI6958593.1 hypothetical protein KC329_g17637 [Hortaea werneckii]KAI7008914.1 hypothetical protein KC366_g17589 [Hortaea werneckii]KAI7055483.1 hypothetical protein KC327_g17654 [Hortaea werneckii]KAI7114067.1 hypothetical protein KC337_g17857 [Hortaea werneckii]